MCVCMGGECGGVSMHTFVRDIDMLGNSDWVWVGLCVGTEVCVFGCV